MRWMMILYLVVAGVFLLIAPWTALWDRNLIVRLISDPWRADFWNLWLRALVASFGVAHLGLAAGDLYLWWRRASRKPS